MVLSYDHAILPAVLLSMGAWSRSSQSTWSVLQASGIGSIVGMWPLLASVKFNEGGVVEISERRYPFSVRFLSYENIACSSHKDLTKEGLLKNDGGKDRKAKLRDRFLMPEFISMNPVLPESWFCLRPFIFPSSLFPTCKKKDNNIYLTGFHSHNKVPIKILGTKQLFKGWWHLKNKTKESVQLFPGSEKISNRATISPHTDSEV